MRRASLDGWHDASRRAACGIVAQASARGARRAGRAICSRFDAAFSFLIGREIRVDRPARRIALVRDSRARAAASGSAGRWRASRWTTFDGAFACVLAATATGSRRGWTLFHEIHAPAALAGHRSALIPRWYTEGLADALQHGSRFATARWSSERAAGGSARLAGAASPSDAARSPVRRRPGGDAARHGDRRLLRRPPGR